MNVTMKLMILNGPNLNLLGRREPEIYGTVTMESYLEVLRGCYDADVEIEYFQSNCEGAIIDALHRAGFDPEMKGIVLNAGAYAHTSLAIHDAIRAIDVPVVEVHISNIGGREEVRRRSLIAPACRGVIAGFGMDSYRLGVEAVMGM